MAKEKGKTIRKSNATTDTKETANVKPTIPNDEILNAAPAKTLDEALGNVLLEIPSSAQKAVKDGTHFLMRSVMSDARNLFQRGKVLSEIKNAVTDKTFTRLINEVWSRFNLNRVKILRWIARYTVISVSLAAGDDIAIDAFLTATDNQNVIESGKDGEEPTLTGAFVAALRKWPVPKKGTNYEACLDWAREVAVFAEKRQPNVGSTMSDIYKACIARYKMMLNGRKTGKNQLNANISMAVDAVVTMYRMLEVKSEPAALAAFAAFESSDISAEQAGKNAMIELRHAAVTKAGAEAHEALETARTAKPSRKSA